MHPSWLTTLSWIGLGIGLLSLLIIATDISFGGYRQRMRVMEAVWPVTALYLGPIAVWMYYKYGRPNSTRWLDRNDMEEPPDKPGWANTAIGVSHCGAGCTLGDIIAETAVFLIGIEIAGRALWPEMTGDYIAALALGILFQYFAIAPMSKMGLRAGLVAAAKADVLSLTAFEVGLFGWMAMSALVLFRSSPVHPDGPIFWFIMQIGMIIGFATAWPANVWLIRRGIKKAM